MESYSLDILIPSKHLDLLVPDLLKSLTDFEFDSAIQVRVLIGARVGDWEECKRKDLLRNQAEIFTYSQPFNFSDVVNSLAEKSQAEFILICNDDVRFLSSETITPSKLKLCRSGFAFGAKQFLPSGSLIHSHVSTGLRPREKRCELLNSRFVLTENLKIVRAVNFAFFLVASKSFKKIGGLNTKMKIGLSDVDFCLRFNRTGSRILVDNQIPILHLSGATRFRKRTTRTWTTFVSDYFWFLFARIRRALETRR